MSFNTEDTLSTVSSLSTSSRRTRKTYDHMQIQKHPEFAYEIGVDEVARGTLCGRVYTAAVILPKEFPDNDYKYIRDSKTLSAKQREKMRTYIEQHAVAWAIDWAEVEEIDEYNILNATMRSMHRAVDKLIGKVHRQFIPDFIVVDGPKFPNYVWNEGGGSAEARIRHECINKGDATYRNIAAASIIAKTYHDDYIRKLVETNPEYAKYGWLSNMGYGTAAHIKAIREYGLTPIHRRSFGICKDQVALEMFREEDDE